MYSFCQTIPIYPAFGGISASRCGDPAWLAEMSCRKPAPIVPERQVKLRANNGEARAGRKPEPRGADDCGKERCRGQRVAACTLVESPVLRRSRHANRR